MQIAKFIGCTSNIPNRVTLPLLPQLDPTKLPNLRLKKAWMAYLAINAGPDIHLS